MISHEQRPPMACTFETNCNRKLGMPFTVRKERVSENSTPTETAAVFAPSRFHWQFTNTETGTGNVRTSFQSFRLAFT